MNKEIEIIGLPYLMGRRAPGEGYQIAKAPEVLLGDDSLAKLLSAEGFITHRQLLEGLDDATAENTGGDHRLLPLGDQMSRVFVQGSALARATTRAIQDGRFPLIAGGTCTSGIGAVAGIMGAFPDDETIGMIWFDGHDDAQTPETSFNGFIEGMPVSIIAGDCWKNWRRSYPGFREIPYDKFFTIGDHERYDPTGRPEEWHGNPRGHFVSPPVIKELGYECAVERELDRLDREGVKKIYVHIDPDAVDPSEFESCSHVAHGGISVAQLLWAVARAAERFQILAINLSAWDPDHDLRSRPFIEQIMVESTKSALQA